MLALRTVCNAVCRCVLAWERLAIHGARVSPQDQQTSSPAWKRLGLLLDGFVFLHASMETRVRLLFKARLLRDSWVAGDSARDERGYHLQLAVDLVPCTLSRARLLFLLRQRARPSSASVAS
jgi:hypothetical protein